MNDSTKLMVESIIRRAARVIVGALLAKGWVSDSETEIVSGLVVLALTEGWSIYNDWRARKAFHAATTPPNQSAGDATPDPKQ